MNNQRLAELERRFEDLAGMVGDTPEKQAVFSPPAWSSAPPSIDTSIVVYGTLWCATSQMVRRHLDRLGVPYRYVDLEWDPGAASRVAWLTGGYVSHPTVSVGGAVLVEPSIPELDNALLRTGIVRRSWGW